MIDEQVKAFWLACGFKQIDYLNTSNEVCASHYVSPDESWGKAWLPSLDGIEALGFLFRYAVPKIGRVRLEHVICANVGIMPKPEYAEIYTEPCPDYYVIPVERWHWYAASVMVKDGWTTPSNSQNPARALFKAISAIMEE